MNDKAAIIAQTKKWLSSVVIAHNLCPFAKREFDLGRIHYEVIEAKTLEAQLEGLIIQCAKLDENKDIETSLLIFPNGVSDFNDYLDLLDLATALIKTQNYKGTYQLASFHPDYRFEGVPAIDASHYTNRSPYPMLHILREASVEAAVKVHPNPKDIPERNVRLMRGLGVEVMEGLLLACYE